MLLWCNGGLVQRASSSGAAPPWRVRAAYEETIPIGNLGMAAQGQAPPKPYTEAQKSFDIPNVQDQETMVIVLARFVGLQPDNSRS